MIDFSSPAFHKGLIIDRARSLAYQKAIQSVIRPGDSVLDIGAGSGILSLFACQAGAARVYAVERTGMANMARALAAANGYEDRLTVLQQDIFAIDLPERVDVVVSELISQGLVGQNMEAITEHARTHLLKPGGKIIPETVDYFMAPVACETVRAALAQPEIGLYGLNFSPLRNLFFNVSQSIRLADCKLLAEPQPIYRIDSMTVDDSQRPRATRHFSIDTDALCDGIVVWFDSTLAPGVQLDSRGSCPSWSAVLFPLTQSQPVSPGTEIILTLSANQLSNGDCVYQWSSQVTTADHSGNRQQQYCSRQSTLSNFIRRRDRT